MLTLNEFVKQLTNRSVDKQTAYMLTVAYDALIEVNKQVELNAKVLLNMANTMQSFVKLSEDTRIQIEELRRAGRPDGIDVKSVANDPERD